MDKIIVIVGGNGFLGRCLSQYMLANAWQVRVIARRAEGVADGADFHQWDGVTMGEWSKAFEGAHAVVNMAGRTVNCRYTETHKAEIVDSRTRTTELVADAINLAKVSPSVWLNSSTATIYRHAEDRAQTDEEGELGTGFSVEVAKRWENCFFEAEVPDTVRKVATRTAIVLGDEAGTVWDVLQGLSKKYLGGKMGSGKQKVSWIHIEDFCRAVEWLIDEVEAEGCYNVSAPGPTDNCRLMELVRESVGVSFGLPATKWMLEIGAFFLRTETELILKSRWVIATRLEKEGFEFRYRTIEACIESFKEVEC